MNDRRSDIPMLIDHFISQICEEYGTKKKGIDKEAVKMLSDLNWTGNIRELRNVIERLIILSQNNITAADINQYVVNTTDTLSQLEKLFSQFDTLSSLQAYIKESYEKSKGMLV